MNRFAMNATKFATLLSLVGLIAVGCSNKQVYEGNSAAVRNDSAKPTAELQVEWVKNKDTGLDMMVWLTNVSKTQIYVKQSSFHVDYEGHKTGAFNVPAFIELQAGERRQILLIFKLGADKPRSGVATLTIDPINEGQIEKPGAALAPLKLKLPVAPGH